MADHEPLDGRLLVGRYRIGRLLGRGGMGAVWAAQDEVLGRPVAVKEVTPSNDLPPAQRDMVRKRAMREARAAARITHPSAVTVYDVIEAEGRPWIVMQLLPPRTLADVLAESGRLSPAAAAAIGVDLLDALRSAHRVGVLHRDVKPANVIFAESGRAVLTDFGIATVEDDPTLTSTGMLVGSPGYMSPERARGDKPTAASDLWSLGATLYAAVEGDSPFRRQGQLPTLNAVITEPAPVAQHAGPLQPVIAKLLAKDPDERPDVDEVRDLLVRVSTSTEGAGEGTGTHSDVSAPVAPTRADDPVAPTVANHDRTTIPWGFQRVPAMLPLPTSRRSPEPEPTPGAQLDPEPTPVLERGLEPTPAPTPEPEPAAETRPAPEHPTVGSGLRPQLPATASPAQPAQAAPNERQGMGEPPSAGRSGGRRRPLILAAVALVLALVVVAVVANRNAGYRSAATAGASSGARAASSATARPRTAASNASTVGAAPATPTSDPSDEGADGSSGDPVSPDTPTVHIPAGFSLYRDVTGFSVAVPRGWTRSKRGTSVYFRNGRSYLQIDQTTHPQPDALRDWKNEEASADRRFNDYHLVRLEAIDYRNWDAADWEFTWRASSGTLHVINRNIRVNNHRAYALYWSVPAADWNQRWSDFELVARTFVPAS